LPSTVKYTSFDLFKQTITNVNLNDFLKGVKCFFMFVCSVQRWKWVSVGQGSWVKWVTIFGWVTWVTASVPNCAVACNFNYAKYITVISLAVNDIRVTVLSSVSCFDNLVMKLILVIVLVSF